MPGASWQSGSLWASSKRSSCHACTSSRPCGGADRSSQSGWPFGTRNWHPYVALPREDRDALALRAPTFATWPDSLSQQLSISALGESAQANEALLDLHRFHIVWNWQNPNHDSQLETTLHCPRRLHVPLGVRDSGMVSRQSSDGAFLDRPAKVHRRSQNTGQQNRPREQGTFLYI